jgi:serine/threonine-protein kinase
MHTGNAGRTFRIANMKSSLWSELQRRQVPKAAAGYAVVAWLLLQVADVTFGPLGIPGWVSRVLVVASILGFPLVVALAWFFDLTRSGVAREGEVANAARPRRSILVIAVSLGVAVVAVTSYLLAPRLAGQDDGTVKTVVVFQFDNLSGDDELDDLAVRVSDELRRRLGPIDGLRVIARESVRSPILAGLSSADVAQRLGATHAVRGSLRRAGANLWIQLSLERMATGEQLWSTQFERPADRVLDLQSQATEAVGLTLGKHLTDEQRAQLHKQPTDNEQAWALYQRAVRWTDEWTVAAAETAIRQLEEATRLDPDFALAYAALSDAYWGPLQMAQLPVKESLPKFRSAIDKALTIDPNLSDAWASAGIIAGQIDWNPGKSLSLGRRAVEIDPNSVLAWTNLSQYYMVFDPGNPEARKVIDTLVKLNPVAPWLAAYPAALAVNAYQTMRQPELLDEALATLAPAKQLGPELWVLHNQECRALRWQGHFAEAIAACQRAVKYSQGSLENDPYLAVAFAVANKREPALEILHKLEQEAQRRYLPPFWFAFIHAALGNRAECLAAVERGLQERDWYMVWELDEPVFDFVRDDPRFQVVYRELGIRQPAIAGKTLVGN